MKYSRKDKLHILEFSLLKKNENIQKSYMALTTGVMFLTVAISILGLGFTLFRDYISLWLILFVVIVSCMSWVVHKKYKQAKSQMGVYDEQYQALIKDLYPGIEKDYDIG